MDKFIYKTLTEAETNRLRGIISPILPTVTPLSGIFSVFNIPGSYYNNHLRCLDALHKSQKFLASTESVWGNVGGALTRATQAFNQGAGFAPDFDHFLPFQHIENYGTETAGDAGEIIR